MGEYPEGERELGIPTQRELIVARFARFRRSLDEVLANLSDDFLDWAPQKGMRTVREQLFEIAGKEVELLGYAKERGQSEWVEVESFGPREESIAGWKEILAEIRTDTLAYIDSLADDELEAIVAFGEDWWEGLGLRQAPLHEVLRNIAAHEWYHTGQLYTYLWIRGTIDPAE